jgi:hypothetical protein
MTLTILDPRTGDRVVITVADKPSRPQGQPAKIVRFPSAVR